MNILITGAEGFLGRNLAELFLADGYTVLHPTVKELDLTCSDCVADFFGKNQVDVIIHSATTLWNGSEYPVGVSENNLRMFFNLQRAMKPATKMINFGSGSEYSRKYWHKKMHEDFFDQHVPEDSHSFSKYLISKYIHDAKHLNMVSLRIFGIFGKYEDYLHKFISNSIAKNLLRMPITINQNVVYDYVYVVDFYKVVKHFVDHDFSYKSYNVTPIDSIDLISIVNMVNTVGNYNSEIRIMNGGIGVYYSGDNKRLLGEMKNFQTMDLNVSITDLYGYYEKNMAMINRAALEKDGFLAYAQKLKNDYFDTARKT